MFRYTTFSSVFRFRSRSQSEYFKISGILNNNSPGKLKITRDFLLFYKIIINVHIILNIFFVFLKLITAFK